MAGSGQFKKIAKSNSFLVFMFFLINLIVSRIFLLVLYDFCPLKASQHTSKCPPAAYPPNTPRSGLWTQFQNYFQDEFLFFRTFVRQTDQNLFEKQIKHLQETSLKLLPKCPKLQINPSGSRCCSSGVGAHAVELKCNLYPRVCLCCRSRPR